MDAPDGGPGRSRGRNTVPTGTTLCDRSMLGLYCSLLFMLFAFAAFVVASGTPIK